MMPEPLLMQSSPAGQLTDSSPALAQQVSLAGEQ
jgi:hypothetical protein